MKNNLKLRKINKKDLKGMRIQDIVFNIKCQKDQIIEDYNSLYNLSKKELIKKALKSKHKIMVIN